MQDQKKYLPRGHASGAGAGLLREKQRIDGKAIVDEGIKSLAYAGAAYLLGSCRLFFGSYPMGLALLCSSAVKIPFILTGLIASAFSGTPYPSVYVGIYVIAALLRVMTRIFIDTVSSEDSLSIPLGWMQWVRRYLFSESLSLRMTVASLSAFIISIYTIITGGYRYYDLIGAIFAIIISPALVWLFYGWFAKDGNNIKVRIRYLLGTSAFLVSICYSARDLSIMGISAAAFGAFFMTLWICRRHGVLAGAAAGLLLGLAYEPVYAPLFVLAAIAEGLLHGFSPTLAAAAAFATGMTWGLYIDGIDALTRLLPGILLSSAAFCGAERAGFLGGVRSAERVSTPREEKLTAEADFIKCRVKSDEERLAAVSRSFASLSEVFYNLSDRLRRPGIIDLRRVCDKIFDKSCLGCAKRDICWGLEYGSSLDMVARLCTALHESGRADIDCIPEQIRKRCPKAAGIISDINTGCAALTEAVLRSEKISIFALDYEAMSRIISDALEEQRGDFCRSADYESKVVEALELMGMCPQVLYVWGGRRKYISARGIDPKSAKTDVTLLRNQLEKITDSKLDDPIFELSGNGSLLSMTLSTRRRYTAERVCHTAPAEDTAAGVCGDSTLLFENGRDYFYALISDGMGTGCGAAFSSGVCSLFLEKMLIAGNRTSTALRMLNGVLRSRAGARELECSATVDLLEVDLLTGEASLIKSGAAPTYIRREGDVFRLHSKTVPIGILTALDAQVTKLEVSCGDVIVMVSDGVVDAAKEADEGEGECVWLPDLLSHEWEDDLSHMAKKIIGRAQSCGGKDDLSVVIVRIGEY